MSREKYDDNCADCKPKLLDIDTGQVMPPDSPQMMAVTKVWEATTLIERQAWHRVTCLNSRMPMDLRLVDAMARRIEAAFEEIDE